MKQTKFMVGGWMDGSVGTIVGLKDCLALSNNKDFINFNLTEGFLAQQIVLQLTALDLEKI